MRLPTFKALCLVLCALPTMAVASDLWGVASVTSYHVNPVKKFNQNNPGIGLEYHASQDVLYTAGIYRNSNYQDSIYATVGWTPLHLGPLSFGAAAGLINGYHNYNNGGIAPVAFGLVRLEGTGDLSRLGVNLSVLPPIPSKHTPLTFGLQIKYKL